MTRLSVIKITSLPFESTEVVGVHSTRESLVMETVKSSYAKVFSGHSVYGVMTGKNIHSYSSKRNVNRLKFRREAGLLVNV
jgi:hypothetical protein